MKPSASTPITRASLFKVIAHSPVLRSSAAGFMRVGGAKRLSNRTREFVTVQMVGLVNVSRLSP